MKAKEFLTDEQVELEIIRLRNSDLVKLAVSGLTLEMLEADMYGECDDND